MSMTMKGQRCLCVLYVATAGCQGPRLGSDEEEVVLLIYIVIDVAANKVIGAQQYVVKPMMSEHSETVLSEHILAHSGLTEEILSEKGVSLGNALIQFDEYIRSLQIDPCSPDFVLVTDGQYPLRQCLHPESCNKNIDLAPYYNAFHDLRKDFRGFYSAPDAVNSIKEMINYLSMTFDTENEFYVKEAKDMVNIVHRLIADDGVRRVHGAVQQRREASQDFAMWTHLLPTLHAPAGQEVPCRSESVSCCRCETSG